MNCKNMTAIGLAVLAVILISTVMMPAFSYPVKNFAGDAGGQSLDLDKVTTQWMARRQMRS
jgi:hypothetical protein